MAGGLKAGLVGDFGDGKIGALEEVDAGAEALGPEVAGGGGAELTTEEADEVLGRDVAGGGEVAQQQRLIEAAADGLTGGGDGGVLALRGPETAGETGLMRVEHQGAGDEWGEDRLGRFVGLRIDMHGCFDSRALQAVERLRKRQQVGRGIQEGKLFLGERIGDDGHPRLEAGRGAAGALVVQVLGTQQDGTGGRDMHGRMASGGESAAGEGYFSGMDEEQVVRRGNRHAAHLAGVLHGHAEAGTAVGVWRRHLEMGQVLHVLPGVVSIAEQFCSSGAIAVGTECGHALVGGTAAEAMVPREQWHMEQRNAQGVSRRRLVGGGAAVGGMMLAACGQGAGESGAGGSGQAGGQASGQITFLSRDTGSDVEPYKQGIEKFHAAQNRVKVTHDLSTGNFEQKFQTLVAAGTVPEVSYMHSQNVPTFATQGFLQTADAYAKRDKAALDGLLPAAVETYRWKNSLYGVPDVATSLVMFINTSLFAKAGAAKPGEKWTWGEFLSTAQKLQNVGRAEGGWAAADYNGGFPRYTVLWQNDADLLNKDRTAVTVDQPAALEALQWIADLMLRHQVHPKPADMTGTNPERLFLEGKVAMLPGLSSRMGTIAKGAEFEVEVLHLPQNKKRLTRTACGGTAMPKGSKNPDAGWELEKFFATEDFQWLIARAGGIIFPAHKKVTDSAELFAGGPFPKAPKVTVDAIAYARTEAYTVGYQDLVAAFNKEADTIWKGESSVKDAMTRARTTMETILKDAQAK